MELFTDTLTKRELKQAANYLAVVYMTGWKATHMHVGTNWATTVLLGTTMSGRPGRVYDVVPEALPLVEKHPLTATIQALEAQGYRVNRDAQARGRKISAGVLLLHSEDFRTAVVDVNGTARLLDGPDGKWAYAQLGNPGQEVRA